jgi:hypothetical protein
MALKHFLYACPWCGELPLEGVGTTARCPGCGRSFVQAGSDPLIRVTVEGGEPRTYPPGELSRRLSALAVPERLTRVTGPGVLLEARVTARFALQEEPIRTGNRLLGMVEKFGPLRPGRLGLHPDRLHFLAEGDGPLEDRDHAWALRDVRAVQTSSSAIQFAPVSGGVLTFAFEDASPLLWAECLEARLREVWREEGRGEILEFQPRIRTS